MRPPLLVLRPEPGWSRTAARATAAGWDVCGAPLFTVEALAWEPPDAARFDALLLTSANAATSAGEDLKLYAALPCFCVGAQTTAAAREAGFNVVHSGTQDARAAAIAVRDAGFMRALHLCGREHMDAALSDVSVSAVPVYASEPVEELPPAAQAGLGRAAIALVHSPRAGRLFASLVDRAGVPRSQIELAAISGAARDAAGHGWRRAVAASAPTDAALLAATAALCDGGAR